MNIHAITFSSWKLISATLLLAAVALCAAADPTPKMCSYTGTVICVDTNRQTFQLKHAFWPPRQFAYGDKCDTTLSYATLKDGVGSSIALRAGEKVTVRYQDCHGVHVAGRIEQQRMQFSGTVKELNSEQRRLTLHRWFFDRQMKIDPDCATVLGKDQAGTLADIHPGDQVVVVYEAPGGGPVAYQITRAGGDVKALKR